LIDQAEIHKKVLSSNPKERVDAVRKIGVEFAVFPDKDQAWDDLHRLVDDGNSNVRTWAAETIGIAFSYIPDKEKAWKCLLGLTEDDNENVRMDATRALGRAFSHVSDKDRAWDDLHQQTEKNVDVWVRRGVVQALGWAFPHISNKEPAWNDLHRLIADYDEWVRRGCSWALGTVFSYVPDKELAWSDLHRLTRDGNTGVRWATARALGIAFPHILYNELAWSDLLRLTKDSHKEVRWTAAESLGLAYPYNPDKKQAWDDIHRLTASDNDSVRHGIAMSLGTAFPYVPDKEKELAQKDLHRLTEDVTVHVRMWAVKSLGIAFPYVPNEQQAWCDLHQLLTEDDDNRVRWRTIEALGQAFPHVSDKAQVWSDLQRLASDEDNHLCVSANHSLGRASIFKAANAENDDDFRNEMENALRFFEISASEARDYYNPSKFCLPFYNSFYAVAFKDGETEAEVERYLGEARVAIGWAKSRDVLLEAMENLAGALQKSREVSREGRQTHLDAWRGYCDNAADLLVQAESDAPIAVEVLRRGLPIIGRRIKAILQEIEDKSLKLREATRQTPFEPLGREICESTRGLADAEYEVEAERRMDDTVQILRTTCRLLPEGTKKSIEFELRDWDNLKFGSKLLPFNNAVKFSLLQIEPWSKEIKDKDDQIKYLRGKVITRLDNVNYNIFRIKIRSADAADSLRALKWELDQVKDIKSDFDRLERKVEDLDVSQQDTLRELKEEMPRIIEDLEKVARERDDQNFDEVLERLEALKRSPKREVFELATQLVSIVGLLICLL